MVRIIFPRELNTKLTALLLQFALGYLFAFTLIALIVNFHKGILKLTFSGWSSWFVSVLLGILLSLILFLMLVEKSRLFCFSIFSASIPIIIILTLLHTIFNFNSFLLGFFIGIFVSIFFVYNVRFDLLARISTLIINIFLIFLLFDLFIYAINSGSYILSQNQILSFIAIIILSILFWHYIRINLKGITSSHVFIFGNTGSGKSVFLAALYLYLVNYHLGGLVNQSVITPIEDRKKILSLSRLSKKLTKGEKIDSTKLQEIALYQIPCKVWNIIPINIFSIDYAGGWTGKLERQRFEKFIQEISDAFSMNSKQLKDSIKNNNFLEELSRFNPDVFNDKIDTIAQMVIYERLSTAGKILFLIDGSKFNSDEDDEELQASLETISKIVQEFGNTKQYGFVVTKADVIEDITDYVENINQYSRDAKEIEDSVYDALLDNYIFKGIMNSINEHPILKPKDNGFFLVSIDKSNKSPINPPTYNPWRLSYIVKYILKF